jgi:hypothetical protein
MKTYKILALIFSVLLLIIFGLLLFYNRYALVDVISQPVHVEVGEPIGIEVGKQLRFGRVPPGSTSKKKINLTNYNDFPVIVTITLSGNAKDIITVSENDFFLEPQEMKLIVYYASPPKDYPTGNYSGTTKIIIKRKFFK